jgi:hypothetical protein
MTHDSAQRGRRGFLNWFLGGTVRRSWRDRCGGALSRPPIVPGVGNEIVAAR